MYTCLVARIPLFEVGAAEGWRVVAHAICFVAFPFCVSDAPPVSAECRVSQSIRKYESRNVSFNLLHPPHPPPRLAAGRRQPRELPVCKRSGRTKPSDTVLCLRGLRSLSRSLSHRHRVRACKTMKETSPTDRYTKLLLPIWDPEPNGFESHLVNDAVVVL